MLKALGVNVGDEGATHEEIVGSVDVEVRGYANGIGRSSAGVGCAAK